MVELTPKYPIEQSIYECVSHSCTCSSNLSQFVLGETVTRWFPGRGIYFQFTEATHDIYGYSSSACINLCAQMPDCLTVVYFHNISPRCLLTDKRRTKLTITANSNYQLFEKYEEGKAIRGLNIFSLLLYFLDHP